MTIEIPAELRAMIAEIDFEAEVLPVFELFPDAIAIIDDHQTILRTNRYFTELFGYSQEDIRGQHIHRIIPEDQHGEGDRLNTRVSGGEEVEVESIRLAKDGTYIDVLLRGIPIELNDGRQLIIAIYTDIRRRKQAERALLEEEGRAQRYLNTAAVMLLSLDRAGVVTLINRKGCEMLGRPEEEILGKDWLGHFIPEHNRVEVQRIFDLLLTGETEQAERYENSVLTGSGEERVVAWYNTILHDEDGVVQFIFSSGEDVTERRVAEDALRESEQRFRTLTENLNVGVYRTTAGASGQFIEANPAIIEMFSYQDREEFLALDVNRLFQDPVDRERFSRELAETGFLKDREHTLVRKDGSTFIGSESAVAVRDDDGEILFFDGILDDVTGRKLMEQRLLQAEKLESVGQLAGGLAHEFNNLLTGIIGNLELLSLSDTIERGSVESDRIGQIRKSAVTAAGLVDRLLSFSQKQILMPKDMDLNEILMSLKSLLLESTGDDIELQLVSTAEAAVITIDPVRIEQAILALALHARYVMPDGGLLRMEIGLKQLSEPEGIPGGSSLAAGPWVILTVTDSGEPLQAEQLKHIFEPRFESVEVGVASGFLLPSVYGLVKQSGGEMTVESGGEGSTILTLYFPAEVPE